jgi:hypothetical protein
MIHSVQILPLLVCCSGAFLECWRIMRRRLGPFLGRCRAKPQSPHGDNSAATQVPKSATHNESSRLRLVKAPHDQTRVRPVNII